jgi:hypothetical protein
MITAVQTHHADQDPTLRGGTSRLCSAVVEQNAKGRESRTCQLVRVCLPIHPHNMRFYVGDGFSGPSKSEYVVIWPVKVLVETRETSSNKSSFSFCAQNRALLISGGELPRCLTWYLALPSISTSSATIAANSARLEKNGEWLVSIVRNSTGCEAAIKSLCSLREVAPSFAHSI